MKEICMELSDRIINQSGPLINQWFGQSHTRPPWWDSLEGGLHRKTLGNFCDIWHNSFSFLFLCWYCPIICIITYSVMFLSEVRKHFAASNVGTMRFLSMKVSSRIPHWIHHRQSDQILPLLLFVTSRPWINCWPQQQCKSSFLQT